MGGRQHHDQHAVPTLNCVCVRAARYHKFYWSGLYVARSFPTFLWRDASIPRPVIDTFAYWGEGEPASDGAELCGGSSVNYTSLPDNVWGWADNNCSSKQVYVCRIMREWPTRSQSVSAPASLARVLVFDTFEVGLVVLLQLVMWNCLPAPWPLCTS